MSKTPVRAPFSSLSMFFVLPQKTTTEQRALLPALEDQEPTIRPLPFRIRRDNEPDLDFWGMRLAAVASSPTDKGRWWEYRVYKTESDKYVFSKVGRSAAEDERDRFSASHCDPAVCKWENAATSYFGFGDLAKELYAKLGLNATAEI